MASKIKPSQLYIKETLYENLFCKKCSNIYFIKTIQDGKENKKEGKKEEKAIKISQMKKAKVKK